MREEFTRSQLIAAYDILSLLMGIDATLITSCNDYTPVTTNDGKVLRMEMTTAETRGVKSLKVDGQRLL